MSPDTDYIATNYCVSFVDLLGQRVALKGAGLVPDIKNDTDARDFKQLLYNSVGAIARLQKQADEMLKEAQKTNPDSEQRASLTDEQKEIWDESHKTKIESQRWSDGLVSFVNLGDKGVKCHLNGVFHLLAGAGAMCFLGLATQQPIRGAVEIAWGMELHTNELYGAAIARSYELESNIAQYPRIVVGPEAVKYLILHQQNTSTDTYDEINREIAKLCLSLLAIDQDGYWIVHYLGEAFQKAVSDAEHRSLYAPALKYVKEQLVAHRRSGDSKLAFRYVSLLSYFEAHTPNAA